MVDVLVVEEVEEVEEVKPWVSDSLDRGRAVPPQRWLLQPDFVCGGSPPLCSTSCGRSQRRVDSANCHIPF